MNPRALSQEETELIREACILPYMMEIIEKNNRQISHYTYTLVPFWVTAGEKLLDVMNNRLREVNKGLRQARIKVWEDRHSADMEVVYFKYVVRGYTEEIGMMKEHLKSQLRVDLTKYMRDIFKTD